jgi:hypothetical protein
MVRMQRAWWSWLGWVAAGLGLSLLARGRYTLVQGAGDGAYALDIARTGLVPEADWPMGRVHRPVRVALQWNGQTLEASRFKAYTSASARNTTLAMMEAAQKNPAAANLQDIPGFLLLGGGVPVRAGNEVIGAVGVGGAPGGHLDEQCAMAALEQGKAALQ